MSAPTLAQSDREPATVPVLAIDNVTKSFAPGPPWRRRRIPGGGLAYAFPDYGAGRVVIDGAFSAGFHAWGELALASAWLVLLGLAVAWALRRLLRLTS